MKNSSRFFRNNECEYFPCHKTVDLDNFSCLFCFCPLYHDMGCGGHYTVLENGCKDCSKCLIPHKDAGYDHIIKKLK